MITKGLKITYKKGKRGFTLVELIAVIIIIGVLLLVIIPNVSGVLKRAEQKTFAASARGVLRSSTDYFADSGFTITEGQCINATSGTVALDKDYQITGGQICYIDGKAYLKRVTNGKYCATGNTDSLTVKLCSESVSLTFQVLDAFNDYFGYIRDNSDNVFLANSNDFALINGYGSGDVTSIVMEVEAGKTLGTYIDLYKKIGTVSYDYNSTSYNQSMTYYSFWDLEDTSMDSCYSMVPAVWDKELNSTTLIDDDMIYTVLALGSTYTCP